MRSIPLAIFVWLTLHGSGSVRGVDWPTWRGPHHDSSAEVLSFSANSKFEELWSAEVGTGFSSIVVSGGKAVTMGNRDDQDVVSCLDVESGKLLWEYKYDAALDPNLFEGGPTATPTIDGSAVLTLSRRGDVFCLDLESGTVRWQGNPAQECSYDVPSWGFSGSPFMHDGKVILNMGSAGVALDRNSGAVVWKSDNVEEAGYSTPVLFRNGDKDLVLIMSGKNANAVDPRSGELVWQHRWITRYGVNAADPYPYEGHVFLSSGYGKGSGLIKLGESVPTELWRSRDLRNQLSPGILHEGHVYAVDGDAGSDCELVCFSIENQKRTWSYSGLGAASLIRSGNHLVILSEEGELVVAPISAQQFTPLFKQQVTSGRCWTMPALANGVLYIRNAEGRLTAWKNVP